MSYCWALIGKVASQLSGRFLGALDVKEKEFIEIWIDF
jgi:ABC-type microcin C transport system permease subunit YejE